MKNKKITKKSIKTFGTNVAKKNQYIRYVARDILGLYRRMKYKKNTRGVKVHSKIVVFNSFNGKGYSDSPKAIYEYMLSREEYKDYRFIWIFKDPAPYQWLKENERTYVVRERSVSYDKALAKAKYWVCNYRIYDFVHPKDNQVYIQCWHGTPLKRLGYDIEATSNDMNSIKEIRDKYRTDASRFRYILSPSGFATEKFSSAWNLVETGQTNKVLELGYPRDDFMTNYSQADVDQIKEKLNIPEDKKVLLYAPTWRDNQHTSGVGYVYNPTVDFKKMREKIGDEWVVLFRAHYLVANEFDFAKHEGFVYDVSSYDDINHLYVISDMLITDYSSVFFDYSILKRPMIYYMYDLELYKNDLRGFYVDLEELPGPIIEKEDALFETIRDYNSWFSYNEKYQNFNKKYNALNDGKATERFCQRVFSTDNDRK